MSGISRRLAIKSMLLGLPTAYGCRWRTGSTRSARVLAPFYENPLETLEGLEIHASEAEIVPMGNDLALSLNGMVVLPGLDLAEGCVEVDILGADSCYPGIAFHLRDTDNFELAYGVPHASGQPDAIQYDPVFNGSNTWQVYCGPGYQQSASVPQGRWFTLQVSFLARRAEVRIDSQAALLVNPLAHDRSAGRTGLWTYGRALFKNLRISGPLGSDFLPGDPVAIAPGTISEWTLPGVGNLACEPNGVLNLNRYLRRSDGPVTVIHKLHMPASQEVELGLGYSDRLILRLDGETVFEGQNEFSGFESLGTRGWIVPGSETVVCHLGAGSHELAATVAATEPFGWGLAVTATPGHLG